MGFNSGFKGLMFVTNSIVIQGDQNVSVHLTITVQSSGAQTIFDHPVQHT